MLIIYGRCRILRSFCLKGIALSMRHLVRLCRWFRLLLSFQMFPSGVMRDMFRNAWCVIRNAWWISIVYVIWAVWLMLFIFYILYLWYIKCQRYMFTDTFRWPMPILLSPKKSIQTRHYFLALILLLFSYCLDTLQYFCFRIVYIFCCCCIKHPPSPQVE